MVIIENAKMRDIMQKQPITTEKIVNISVDEAEEFLKVLMNCKKGDV